MFPPQLRHEQTSGKAVEGQSATENQSAAQIFIDMALMAAETMANNAAAPDSGAVDLYAGSLGEALFFSALFGLTRETTHRTHAQQILHNVAATLMAAFNAPEMPTMDRGITGLGGFIYGLVRCATFLDDEQVLLQAQAVADRTHESFVVNGSAYDVGLGVAGGLLGLLSLPTPRSVHTDRLIRSTSSALLKLRRFDRRSGLRGWGYAPDAIDLGFSHGTAGVAYTLFRVYEEGGDHEFHDAAVEACTAERAWFSGEQRDWPDGSSRSFGPVRRAWCRGAAGIGLSRVYGATVASLANQEPLLEDVSNAINCVVARPLAPPINLCCGILGRIDLLLEAGTRLEQPALIDLARSYLIPVCDRVLKEENVRSAGPGRSTEMRSLWKGLSGIGYTALRALDPITFPSVLTLS